MSTTKKKMKNVINVAFVVIIFVFSTMSLVGVVVFGLTNISLAFLIGCVVLTTLFSLKVKSIPNEYKREKFETQVLGIWPDDIEDHVNKIYTNSRTFQT